MDGWMDCSLKLAGLDHKTNYKNNYEYDKKNGRVSSTTVSLYFYFFIKRNNIHHYTTYYLILSIELIIRWIKLHKLRRWEVLICRRSVRL